MSDIQVTRLRYIRSKNPDSILEYVNKLIGYKIEIKGSPVFAQGKWYLWFILPDHLQIGKESIFGDIDL